LGWAGGWGAWVGDKCRNGGRIPSPAGIFSRGLLSDQHAGGHLTQPSLLNYY
jgi:hypothetical protein